jgi:hypothetical protein
MAIRAAAVRANHPTLYELTEVLDAHHLFRALTGKIQGYGITLPQLQTETFEGIRGNTRDAAIRPNSAL